MGIFSEAGQKGKATKHLDAVDYHHNHTESTRKRQSWSNGYVYVELHVQIGPFGFLFDTWLYLREKKVRQLNRSRSKEKRLRYDSKYNLAREMLLELDTLLPTGSQVYVLFDYVRTVSGHLEKVPQEVYVILSKKNAPGIPAPSTSSVQTPAFRLRKP